jgi:DNA-directed RNA polymerase subunit A"
MSNESQEKNSVEEKLPQNLVDEIEEVVKRRKLNKEQAEELKNEVVKNYSSERFEPGDVIGIIAAQSISEPATQMTMRTYHFAGSAGIRITYGLPRLMEIFDARRVPETPVMMIYLKRAYNNRDEATRVAEKIVEKKISSISKVISINLGEGAIEIEPTDLKRIGTIKKAIRESNSELKIKVGAKKISVSPAQEIDIREMQKIKENIMKIHVEGVKGIQNAVVRREEEDWIINTIGSNLEEVLKVKEVDERRTMTNDVHEVKKVLGIEAARNLIISEALETMQEQGLDVNVRHVMLVSDIMCFNGDVRPIGRYGVAGAKASILARAAFEETIKHLVKASVRNEVDSFQGIFENVMIGQVIPSGTGMFDLIAKTEEDEKK